MPTTITQSTLVVLKGSELTLDRPKESSVFRSFSLYSFNSEFKCFIVELDLEYLSVNFPFSLFKSSKYCSVSIRAFSLRSSCVNNLAMSTTAPLYTTKPVKTQCKVKKLDKYYENLPSVGIGFLSGSISPIVSFKHFPPLSKTGNNFLLPQATSCQSTLLSPTVS